MNEQIKELSAIAKYLTTDETIYLGRVHNRTLSLDEEQEIFVEKFAELIVEKCADVAKYHTPDTEECEHTWLIHDKIKEHFGVK